MLIIYLISPVLPRCAIVKEGYIYLMYYNAFQLHYTFTATNKQKIRFGYNVCSKENKDDSLLLRISS